MRYCGKEIVQGRRPSRDKFDISVAMGSCVDSLEEIVVEKARRKVSDAATAEKK